MARRSVRRRVRWPARSGRREPGARVGVADELRGVCFDHAEERFVLRHDRRAHVGDRQPGAFQLDDGGADEGNGVCQLLDLPPGPVVLDQVCLSMLGLVFCSHATTLRAAKGLRNQVFPYGVTPPLAGCLDMSAPSSARERMPSFR
jgi:hypothetical protein